jgi:hypothetical protein
MAGDVGEDLDAAGTERLDRALGFVNVASTSSSDTAATKAGKRFGWRATSSAIASLATRARSAAVSPCAISSSGGLGSEMTWR